MLMSKKAIVAMSGGVDSSVAAYLLIKKGYNCIGATMRLYEDERCSSADSVADARSVAERLSIPYYVFDFRNEFKEKVIENFIHTYENGGTPNPCIECNRHLKFEMMLKEMDELSADYVATGHYARVVEKDGWYYLKKAVDTAKDQSYVLYTLTQKQLSRTLFPLGEFLKPEIRDIAEKEGFLNAGKKDSQDICFVPDGNYIGFIEKYTGKIYPDGNFVDRQGHVLGRHQGIIRYTNGQRKGLGVSFGKPMYVVDKDIKNNAVILGENDELFSAELTADDFNWLIPNPEKEIRCNARVRYNMKEQPATAYCLDNGKVSIVFDAPQRAITKGQSAVLYIDDTVIGGGIII